MRDKIINNYKSLTFLFIFFLCFLSQANEIRLSYLFVHYSVGLSAIKNFSSSSNYRNIRDVLDTLTITNNTDSARIVFRGYNINTNEVYDTIYQKVPSYDEISTGDSYNLDGRVKIFYNNTSPLLNEIFKISQKDSSSYWNFFLPHTISYSTGGSTFENYNMVIIKNPYICWRNMTNDKAKLIKDFYRELRDSVVNHPEINFCFALGTPLCFNATNSDDDFNSDTSMAKTMYELALWFKSNDFFDDNNPQYKNVWRLDTYTPLLELNEGMQNRFCLKTEYWAGPTGQSHLSQPGAEVLQDLLIDFIKHSSQKLIDQNFVDTKSNFTKTKPANRIKLKNISSNQLEYISPDKIKSIKIRDISGKLLFNQKLNEKKRGVINLAKHSRGIKIIEFVGITNKSFITKINLSN